MANEVAGSIKLGVSLTTEEQAIAKCASDISKAMDKYLKKDGKKLELIGDKDINSAVRKVDKLGKSLYKALDMSKIKDVNSLTTALDTLKQFDTLCRHVSKSVNALADGSSAMSGSQGTLGTLVSRNNFRLGQLNTQLQNLGKNDKAVQTEQELTTLSNSAESSSAKVAESMNAVAQSVDTTKSVLEQASQAIQRYFGIFNSGAITSTLTEFNSALQMLNDPKNLLNPQPVIDYAKATVSSCHAMFQSIITDKQNAEKELAKFTAEEKEAAGVFSPSSADRDSALASNKMLAIATTNMVRSAVPEFEALADTTQNTIPKVFAFYDAMTKSGQGIDLLRSQLADLTTALQNGDAWSVNNIEHYQNMISLVINEFLKLQQLSRESSQAMFDAKNSKQAKLTTEQINKMAEANGVNADILSKNNFRRQISDMGDSLKNIDIDTLKQRFETLGKAISESRDRVYSIGKSFDESAIHTDAYATKLADVKNRLTQIFADPSKYKALGGDSLGNDIQYLVTQGELASSTFDKLYEEYSRLVQIAKSNGFDENAVSGVFFENIEGAKTGIEWLKTQLLELQKQFDNTGEVAKDMYQKMVDSHKITENGDKVVNQSEYEKALAIKEVSSLLSDARKDVKTYSSDLEEARSALQKLTPGTTEFRKQNVEIERIASNLETAKGNVESYSNELSKIRATNTFSDADSATYYKIADDMQMVTTAADTFKTKIEEVKIKMSEMANGNVTVVDPAVTQSLEHYEQELQNVLTEQEQWQAVLNSGIEGNKQEISSINSRIARLEVLRGVMDTLYTTGAVFSGKAFTESTDGKNMANDLANVNRELDALRRRKQELQDGIFSAQTDSHMIELEQEITRITNLMAQLTSTKNKADGKAYVKLEKELTQLTEQYDALIKKRDEFQSQLNAINEKYNPKQQSGEENNKPKQSNPAMKDWQTRFYGWGGEGGKSPKDSANGYAQMFQLIEKAAESLKGMLPDLSKAFDVFLEHAGNALKEVTKLFDELVKMPSSLSDAMSQGLGTMADTIMQLGDVLSEAVVKCDEDLEQSLSQQAQMAKSSGNMYAMIAGVVVEQVIAAINKLQRNIASVIKYTAVYTASLLKMGQSMVSLYQRINNYIKEAATNVAKLFHRNNTMTAKKMLNILLKYGLGIRSFYMLFRKIRNMITEGFKSIVKFSERTNVAISNITSAWNQLKGQISASLEPVLVAIEPALVKIINLATEATLKLTKFIGALTNTKQVLKATYIYKDYAESLASANKQLAGFDELNNLTSGSGSGADDALNGWEWVDSEFPDWWEHFKAQWEDGDLSEYGNKLAQAVVDMLNKIPWSNIQAQAKKMGKRLATLISGVFDPDVNLGAKLGETLGNAFVTGINAFAEFVSNFNFANVGITLANAINSLFSKLNGHDINNMFTPGSPNAIADTTHIDDFRNALENAFTGILETVRNFVNELNVSDILGTIKRFLSFDIDNIGGSIADTINSLFGDDFVVYTKDWEDAGKLINQWFSNIFNLLKVTAQNINWSDVFMDFNSFIDGIDFDSLGASLADALSTVIESIGPDRLGQAINKVLMSIMSGISTFMNTLDKSEIEKGLTEFLDALDLGGLIDTFTGLIGKSIGLIPWGAIGTQLTKVIPRIVVFFTKIGRKLIKAVGVLLVHYVRTNLNSAFDDMFAGDTLPEIGLNILRGIVENFLNATVLGTILGGPIGTVIGFIVDCFTGGFEINSPSKVASEWGYYILMGLANGISENVQLVLDKIIGLKDDILTKFGEMKDALVEKFIEIKDNLVEQCTILHDNISEKFGVIKETLSTKATEIKDTVVEKFTLLKDGALLKVTELKDSLTEKAETIRTSLSDKFTNVKTTVVDKFTTMKSRVVEIFESLKNALKVPIDGIITFINSMVSAFTDGINAVIRGINNLAFSPPDWLVTAANAAGISLGTLSFNIPELSKVQIPPLAQGAVLPPNKPFLAQLGDQKNGVNIETPLSTMLEAFNMAFAQNSDNDQMMAMMQQQIQLLTVIANKEFGITNRQIFKSVQTSANEYKNTTGKTAFT